MTKILKKPVPATKRDTNLGLSSRKRRRYSFAQYVQMCPKNFFLFIPFIVSMMTMAPIVWADNVITGGSGGRIEIEQDIESPLPPSPADAEKALGDVFASIREGGKTVGAGQVTEIIESPLPPSPPIVEPGEVIPDYVMLPGFGSFVVKKKAQDNEAQALDTQLEELGAEVEIKSAYNGVVGGFAVGRLNAASPGASPDDSSKFSITHLTQMDAISNSGGLAIEPSSIDFGNVAIGEAVTQTFTFSNSGDNSRSITAIEPVMGLFMDDEHGNVTTLVRSSAFQHDGGSTNTCLCSHLSCGCDFSITFEPQASGTEAALLYISNQDEFGNPGTPLTVPLQGTGIEATLGINIVVEPMSHDFGEVTLGFSDYQLFKVSNMGTVPFKIGQITISEITMPAMGSDFSIKSDSCSEQKLIPANSCFVVVEFKPSSIAEKSANLLIPYGPKTPIYVSLTGTGVGYCLNPPKVQIRPDPIDFGQVSLGSSSSMPVSVYMKAQNCDLPLKVNDITVIGSDAGEFQVRKPLWCRNGISGNTSYSYCRLLVGFRPMEPAGLKEAVLNVIFNDSSTKTVPIKAEAISEPPIPEITVEPTSYNFGEVFINTSSSPYEFTVKNTGNVPVLIRSHFEGINADNFQKDEDECHFRNLSPNETCTMKVVFNPLAPNGQKEAYLQVLFRPLNPSLAVGRISVPLSGMAIEPMPCSDASITIETRQSGKWSDPDTWVRISPPIDTLTTPNFDDVVRINPEHTVTAYHPYPKEVKSLTKKVKSLCIKPTAELFLSNHYCLPDRLPTWIGIRASNLIKNEGTIRGQNGRYEAPCAIINNEEQWFPPPLDYPSWPHPGASIFLVSDDIINNGLIIAGNGASAVRPTHGGTVIINTHSSFSNTGTLIAGNGGDSYGRSAGRGGYITVNAGKNIYLKKHTAISRTCGTTLGDICAGNGGKLLTNRIRYATAGHGGRIYMRARKNSLSVYRTRFKAGDGGNCYAPYLYQRGGHASGDIILLARRKQLVNPWITAGSGGTNCEPGGWNGNDGIIRIDPSHTSISGEDTIIEGGDVTIAGGDNGTIELSELNEGAITATGDLTLAVGEGGVIMTDSTDNILKAEGQVNLFADEIMLGEDVNVSDITGDNVVIGSAQIMRDVSIMTSGNSSGEPGITLPFEVTFSNNGPEKDTYLLTVTDEAGWSLSQLPSSIEIEGHGTAELTLEVVLPTTSEVTNMITVTAISLAEPEIIATSEINIAVTKEITETSGTVVDSGASANVCPSTGTINRMCNNQGQVIKDATLESDANLAGGHFSGTIVNKGIISQATVETDAVLKGGKLTGHIVNHGIVVDIEFVGASLEGGELSGKIVNNSQVGGVFINVRLAANTSIEGGAVQGEVGGDAEAPASLKNVRIKSGTRLSNVILSEEVQLEGEVHFVEGVQLAPNIRLKGGKVKGLLMGDTQEAPAMLEELEVQAGSTLANVIIGDKVQLAKDVVLGEGTRFARRANIPSNVELMGLLPALPAKALEGVTYPNKRADFSADVVVEPSEGILSAMNELPAFKDNAWTLQQDAELSHLELTIDSVRFAVLPVSVKKAIGSGGLKVQEAQSVRFVTDTGLEVLTQPALQAPNVLLSALSGSGISEITVQANGNLQIPTSEGLWFSARPEWLSTELSSDTETGLKFGELPYGSQFISASLVFTDSDGKPREQHLYPSLAQPEVLSSLAKAVSIEADGWVSFTLGNQTYRGVMDYVVTQSESTTDTLQVESIPDANGDGIEDIVLIYPNDEQQIMFVIE
jgi:hypothetical protein